MSIEAPLWRYFIAALDGSGITDYSKLASDRVVEVVLNAPLSMSGTVPSDNPQVWIPYDGDGYDDPYLNEGTRLLWGLRRESSTPPYYTVRAATIVQLVNDEAAQDNARTAFTGWDPWHYMMSRPACNLDGTLPGPNGLQYVNTQASVIIAELLHNTIVNHGFAYIDAGDGTQVGPQYQDYGGSAEYNGTLEIGVGMLLGVPPDPPFTIAQGTSVGEAWRQITDLGVCDIILEPIYVPTGRTVLIGPTVHYNFLVQLNVYEAAGSIVDEAIFAWNTPGRSLVGLSRQEDGSGRANKIQFFAGQGGVNGAGVPQTGAAAVTKYGEYWAQQFFPSATAAFQVTDLASQQLALRASGRTTVTFTPAPERSPRPWQDYYLGDRVVVSASKEKFRKALGT